MTPAPDLSVPRGAPGIPDRRIYYQQDGRVPVTSLALAFHGGGVQQEGEEKAGLARLTSRLLFRGTQRLDRTAIAERFDLLGAEVSATVNEVDFVVSLSCFTRTLGPALDFLREILDEAAFPEAECDLVKKQELSQLTAALQEPERVLNAAHLYGLYGGMRLGKIGSRGAVASITRDDLRDFFHRVLRARVLYATAISDLPRTELEAHLSRFMTDRPTDGFAPGTEVRYRSVRGCEATIFASPRASNDRLIWSIDGLEAADDRRFDLALIVDALGSFEGLLFDILRNKHGWCYGAYAFMMNATTRPGRIGFYADPTGETAPRLVPELIRLLRSFGDDEDFLRRLRERNETFKNRYAYQLDPRFRLASEVSRDRHGVPILDREAYNARIDSVTPESTRTTISSLFRLDNLSMTFYGEPGRIEKVLRDSGIPAAPAVMGPDILIA